MNENDYLTPVLDEALTEALKGKTVKAVHYVGADEGATIYFTDGTSFTFVFAGCSGAAWLNNELIMR